MAGAGPPASEFSLGALPDPGDRFVLGEVIGRGLFGTVYEAQDTEASGAKVAIKVINVSYFSVQTVERPPRRDKDRRRNMKVAVKVLQVDEDRLDDAREEYHVLRDLSEHPNLPDFYGAFAKRTDEGDEIWFVMELCAHGPVTDLVRGLLEQNKKMSEDHIAYILKCAIKALVHMHERHVMHRDVRGSNLLLNANGEIKLVDYGLSRELDSTMGRKSSCLGSPAWLAPEVVACSNTHKEDSEGYDNKCDVWSVGITAIELGDGKAPLQDMHPTRALFQILTNPPPALYRPANWTQLYNDFITECLEKNPENRPFMPELMEHPFITALPENDDHFQTELKMIAETASPAIRDKRYEEVIVRDGFIQKDQSNAVETMVVEDLAAMEVLTEETITRELEERYRRGFYHSFVGDVLLVVNPNADVSNMYGKARQSKYQYKSRSDNQPHVYAVADSAYQDVFHNEEPQRIILAGESMSGKTTNFKHMLTHLLFLGKSGNGSGDRVEKAVSVIQALGNAATPLNPSSTRHVHHLEVTYTATGRASGAIIWLYQLEKWRVTTECQKGNANFHVFYYFYDAMAASSSLDRYLLEPGSGYRYLRASGETCSDKDPRNTQEANVAKYEKLRQFLVDLDFEEEQRECLWRTLAAILILGEVTFVDTEDNFADVENPDMANKVAQLLLVEEKKFVWALTNYCVIQKGTAVRRRHTREEAVQARDVLARALYARLVDWMVNTINFKLSYNRAIFGDKHVVSLTDMFGFETHQKNTLETLFINTFNEQMTYHYGQRCFAWEMQEQEEEEIPLQPLQYYNNKGTVDELMLKPDGLLYLLDEASRGGQGPDFILESLRNEPRGPRISAGDTNFLVAHYTGKVTYDVRAMAAKNRDFLPPEMIETLRLSNDANVKLMFTNQLSKSGNLTAPSPPGGVSRPTKEGPKKTRWGAALIAETGKCRHYNTESRGQYSQTRRMRTAAATFRGGCLEVLRALAFGPGCGGTHFVRCVRANINNQPRVFQQDLVRTQLRALAVLDTARARQKGYSTRVPFEEFLRRYQFLAFDFDESVDITKDNCRLLLIRLKMEGWVLGKTKVFLKYYHEEYLSRLYEQQVKKIIKVQCMMRAFLAKRNMQTKLKRLKSQDSVTNGGGAGKKAGKASSAAGKQRADPKDPAMNEAATVIQRNFRGYKVRKEYGPLVSAGGKLDVETAHFIRHYCHKWKAKSMYQVLLLYRAKRYQDFVYFGQQVHMYNQSMVWNLQSSREPVDPSRLESRAPPDFLEAGADHKPNVFKLPFRLQDPLLLGVFSKVDPLSPDRRASLQEDEPWDAPFRPKVSGMKGSASMIITPYGKRDQEVQTSLVDIRGAAGRDDDRRPSVQYRNGPAAPAFQAPSYATTHRTTNNSNSNNKYGNAHGDDNNNVNKSGGRPAVGPAGARRPFNPVAELELRGQKTPRHQEDSDDPPFNFQAMLRKTNHGRASLKRRGSGEDYVYNSSGGGGLGAGYGSGYGSGYSNGSGRGGGGGGSGGGHFNTSPTSPTPSGRRSRSPRPDSPTRRPRDIPSSVRRRPGSLVSTELAPGIVVHGHVADL